MAELTKVQILAWYEYAKKNLNLRAQGRHPTRVKLSEADVVAYSKSIEMQFKQFKRDFNKRLHATRLKTSHS